MRIVLVKETGQDRLTSFPSEGKVPSLGTILKTT